MVYAGGAGIPIHPAPCTSHRAPACHISAHPHLCRDEALVCWRSLVRMRRLRLAGNFYLSEGALAAVLRAMPRMQARPPPAAAEGVRLLRMG